MRYERQMIARQRPPKAEEKEGGGEGEKVNWQTEKLATVHAMRLGRMRDIKPSRGGKERQTETRDLSATKTN